MRACAAQQQNQENQNDPHNPLLTLTGGRRAG